MFHCVEVGNDWLGLLSYSKNNSLLTAHQTCPTSTSKKWLTEITELALQNTKEITCKETICWLFPSTQHRIGPLRDQNDWWVNFGCHRLKIHHVQQKETTPSQFAHATHEKAWRQLCLCRGLMKLPPYPSISHFLTRTPSCFRLPLKADWEDRSELCLLSPWLAALQ